MTYKLTRKRIKIITEAISKGCTYKIASGVAGVSESTLYNWLSQGRKEKSGLKKELLEEVKKAEYERANFLLERIIEHSSKDWKCSAWLLERRFGYRKDSLLDETPAPEEEIEIITDPKLLLEKQAKELQKAIDQASKSQSWQAYASLQRQLVSIIDQLRQLKEQEGTEVEQMSDEQLLGMIENIAMTLPPLYKQRLRNTLGGDVSGLKVIK